MSVRPSTTPLPISQNTDVEATLNGFRWIFDAGTPRVLDWSVSGSAWNFQDLQSTETQQDFATVFNNISYYINVGFHALGYFGSTATQRGYVSAYQAGSEMNISYAFNGTDAAGNFIADNRFSDSASTAFCYFPSTYYDGAIYAGAAGDTWLNENNPFIASLNYEVGTNGFALLLHEVLHGLGLKHPHDDGGTGRPTYTDLDVPFADRQWITVMSYDRFDSGGDGAYDGSMPIAPMLMDVIALQYLYGESTGSAGNTTHDLSIYSGAYYNTLWDSSGTDLLDAGAVDHGLYIDMGLGDASNGSKTHHVGYITTALDKLSLALLGFNPTNWTWLWGEYENVTGSPYADTIAGNDLNNDLNGGAGDDNLMGGDGNDRLDWDPAERGGSDVLEGGPGDDTYVLDSVFDVVIENSSEGIDTVYCGFDFDISSAALENIGAFSDLQKPVQFIGNSWGNSLTGGRAADQLYGRDGSDTLKGMAGNDTLDGGNGIDFAVYQVSRSGATVSRGGNTVASGADGSDSLSSVERLVFNDMNLAFDLAGNAGVVARILGAVFGPSSVSNRTYVGIGLYYLDGGTSYADLVDLALNARLPSTATNAEIVDLLYTNVVGKAPSAVDRAYYVGLLTSHAVTPVGLAAMAADTDLNAAAIHLSGLATTGLEYFPLG